MSIFFTVQDHLGNAFMQPADEVDGSVGLPARSKRPKYPLKPIGALIVIAPS